MKVGDLIEILKKENPSAEIALDDSFGVGQTVGAVFREQNGELFISHYWEEPMGRDVEILWQEE